MKIDQEKMLEVKGLYGGYGKVPILHGVEIGVSENEIVGILGHNGMGKSTLLKSIMGFLTPNSGSIHFKGIDCSKLLPNERAKLGIGYVPQGRGIFPQLSVKDNLRFAWHRYSPDSEANTLASVLDDFPRLKRLLEREGGELSGGEQQLLSLARCMMGNPSFLLLDEPTEGIQPSIIEEMSDTLIKIRQKGGMSILLVEQNFDFVADLSDAVFVLERGKIIANLTKEDLGNQTKIDEFLGLGAARSTRGDTSKSIRQITKPILEPLDARANRATPQ